LERQLTESTRRRSGSDLIEVVALVGPDPPLTFLVHCSH